MTRAARWTDRIDLCASVLLRGGIATIPTDTVYGVAASIEHPDAIERLYALKGRPGNRPIPILVAGLADAVALSSNFPKLASRLAEAFWPGALTIIVDAAPRIPPVVLSGGNTVGLRMPDHRLALELIEACGGALAVTSANRSGESETRSAADADAALGAKVNIVLDGGLTPGGIASTVVDATCHPPRIVRQGAILAELIHRVSSD